MKDNKVWEVDDPWFDGIYDLFGNRLYRFKPPLFEICKNPMIPLTQVKERRFDFIQRSYNLCRTNL